MVYTHDLKSCLVRDVGSSPTTGKMNEVNFAGEQANCFACVGDSNRMTQCHSAEFSIRKLSPTTGKISAENADRLILRQKLSILKMFLYDEG